MMPMNTKDLPDPFDINEAAGYLCKGDSLFFQIRPELVSISKDINKNNDIKEFAKSIISFIDAKDKAAKLKRARNVIRQTIEIQCYCPIYIGSWAHGISILSFIGAVLMRTSPEDSPIALAAALWQRMGQCRFLTMRDNLKKKEGKIGSKFVLEAAKILADAHIPLPEETIDFLKNNRIDRSKNKVKEIGCSLSSFFNQINLTLPGLKKVETAFEKGNLKEAKKLYTAYLSRRFSKKNCPSNLRDEPLPDEKALAEADEICKNIFILKAHNFKRHNFGKKVDWSKCVDDDIENRVWMNAHPWMRQLAAAYEKTGNEKYVHHLCRLFHSWYKDSPVPFSQDATQWRTLEVGNRPGQKWPFVLFSLAKHPLFCKEMLFDMACSALDHAQYLICFGSGGGNWSQVEASGLGCVAVLFPEFKLSSLFYLIAIKRLVRVNKDTFFSDGLQSECSTAYHMFPLFGISNFYRLAQYQGKEIPKALTGTYEKALEAITKLAYPDFTLPLLSDCGPRKISILEIIPAGYKTFKREDFKWFATKRKEGKPPKETSYNFKDAGYCVMRDGWKKDSQCLIFDAGYFGRGHQHEDKLNFVLFAGGRELIGDPGIYNYGHRDGFGAYWTFSRGHNVVIVDKKTQARRLRRTPEPIPDPDRVFIRRKNFDFAIGWYKDGYSFDPYQKKADKSIQHQRCIFYLKGKYLILCDRLLGKKKRDIELLFHLAPIVTHDKVQPVNLKIHKNKTVVTTESKYANVAIIPAEEKGWNVQDIIGQKKPIGGWYALYGIQPSHDIVYHRKSPIPLHFETVIQPLKAGETNILQVKSSVTEEKNAAILEISGNNHSDIFLFSYDGPCLIKHENIIFNGIALLLERNSRKEIIRAHLIDGKYLKCEERKE